MRSRVRTAVPPAPGAAQESSARWPAAGADCCVPPLVLVTFAVALRRLGVDLLPGALDAGTVLVRVLLEGPSTLTRTPRVRDSATFSAACRRTAQVRNGLSPSCHSLVCRSTVRGSGDDAEFGHRGTAGSDAEFGVVDQVFDDGLATVAEASGGGTEGGGT